MRLGTVKFVRSRLRPLTPIWVEGATRESDVLIAQIDTGFSGWLTLPSRDIERLNLEFARKSRISLADGTWKLVEVYNATIVWWSAELHIEVHKLESDRLIGMSLLSGNVLKIDARDGGPVELEPATEPLT